MPLQLCLVNSSLLTVVIKLGWEKLYIDQQFSDYVPGTQEGNEATGRGGWSLACQALYAFCGLVFMKSCIGK